jgi:hypothetical protein
MLLLEKPKKFYPGDCISCAELVIGYVTGYGDSPETILVDFYGKTYPLSLEDPDIRKL